MNRQHRIASPEKHATPPTKERLVLRRTLSPLLPRSARSPRPLGRFCLAGLYYAGAITEYPAILHARLMIEGFMASFIIGSLGTAGPRITSAPHFSRAEVLLLVTFDLLAAGLHFGGSHRAADSFCSLSRDLPSFSANASCSARTRHRRISRSWRWAFERCDRCAPPRALSKRTPTPAYRIGASLLRNRLCPVADSWRRPLSSSLARPPSTFRALMRCRNRASCRRDGCPAPPSP